MGFLSYNLNFYRNELQKLEDGSAAPEQRYRAWQLLRILEDLTDEGYTELSERLEDAFFGISRLRKYLQRFPAARFSLPSKPADGRILSYTDQSAELCGAISQAMQKAAAMPEADSGAFADKLCRFCRWIGYDEHTAYIFLLRDTLLPFVFYSARNRERIYPWLLSRSFFGALAGRQNADDEIRASIYKALEAGCADSQSFFRAVLPDIRRTILRFPQAKEVLSSMLAGIATQKIIVVESGCAGTFPLLLMSLDDRVDWRMYTTYPYLIDIYKERVFTPQYEENRMFETMAAQEQYFRFTGMRGGRFYVQRCIDAGIEEQSLQEIKRMMAEPCDLR